MKLYLKFDAGFPVIYVLCLLVTNENNRLNKVEKNGFSHTCLKLPA